MERITFEGNFCDISMCRENPCPYNGMCSQRQTWERLKKYEDAEQDGRLVVRPRKIGDRVFHVRRVTQAEAKRMGVTPRYGRIIYYEDRPFAIKEKLCTKSDYAQIGKTVFLTREDAEAALALEGGTDEDSGGL